MKLYQKTLVLASAMAMATTVSAEERGSNWYINPAIGYQLFDSARELDDEPVASLGGEYRFNENWATELLVMDSSPDFEEGDSDVDLMQYGIQGIYYFGANDDFDPYAVLGLGHAEFEGDFSDDQETQYNLGLGFRYALSQNWSLKADTKLIYGQDDDTTDGLISLGLSYAFGHSKPAVMDADSDGVVDASDQCPTTAAGEQVNAEGCALDVDNDGVADSADKCLDTPAGREVDADGCKVPVMSMETKDLNIIFDLNSDVVTDEHMAEVENVAMFLKQYESGTADIQGYTDNSGDPEYNKALSQRRADSVMAVLVERFGISADRLTAEGFGEVNPAESNDTKAGRVANRRVVAVLKAEVEE
jgi:OOP family OmpA-OmpF porin